MTRLTIIGACFASALATTAWASDLTPMEQLGKSLFFDPSLSVNENQPCAFCHDPAQGFSSPHHDHNAGGGVVEGSVPGRFGNRKPPSAAYAGFASAFHHTFEDGDILFVGGAFLDGRATGHRFGTVVADQAAGPFTNPVEMALPHDACVVERACRDKESDAYPVGMTAVWGDQICEIAFPTGLAQACSDPDADIVIEDEELAASIDEAFAAIVRSIAAFETSAEVNPFSSRFDKYLAGHATLNEQELRGLDLFQDKALCAECHVLDKGPRGEPALFTDFTYDNLGVPANPDNPWYAQARFNPDGFDWVDTGLGAFLADDPVYDVIAPRQAGKQKVPTLRNLDKRLSPDTAKAFMHNGYFKTLEGVVRFYNKRDVWPTCDAALTEAEALAQECWPAPEVGDNVNGDELGNLKLTEAEEADLVAFLKTLNDE